MYPSRKIQLKRLFYKLILPIRKACWFIFRPKTYGVKVLIENNGKFLMIRNSYGTKYWTFPGGGKGRNETEAEAATREASEEVGILISNPKHIGDYFSEFQYKKDTVHCFYKKVKNNLYQIDNDEVEEAGWFDISNMPLPQSKAVKNVINLYRENSHH